ncbi:DoxX family protein [uncultured Aquimarina sp.]|uniref:DoxX family protein n=1 Tax=uncultured Aquimarina sp. TaxID=575652 RepID=UPI00263549F5|nr:DoxX family protein [uncultured Aquimarina sp.]
MNLDRIKKYADVCIRLPIGFHLIYGVQDNIFSWDDMLGFREFLESHGFPFPLIAAHISVYAQFICGALFILGYKTRYAALVMVCNFIIAIIAVHLNDPYFNKFPAIMMLFGSFYMLLHGDGYYTIKVLMNQLKSKQRNPPLS